MAEPLGLAPVFVVPDVGAALDYYRDVLGFQVEAWSEDPATYGYATRRGAAGTWTLHFARGAGPNVPAVGTSPFNAYLWVDDVRELHRELSDRGADVLHPPTERPWRMLEIRVRDLNGYILGIGEPVNT